MLNTIKLIIVNKVMRDIKNTNYLYFLAGFVEGEGSISLGLQHCNNT